MFEGIKRKYSRFWQLYLFLLLPFTYILIFEYGPMAGLQIAFKKFSYIGGIWGSPWVGFYQFQKFFNSYQFFRILRNTLMLSAYSIVASFPFPILFAFTLNLILNKAYKRVVQTITCMPHFISTVVLVGLMMQIFHPMVGLYGAIGRLITGQMPPDLMASPAAFPHMYVWSGVWQEFGYGSIIYLAALTNVSQELREAAYVDGANRFRVLVHVDFPAILPIIIIMLILRTGSVMSIGFQKIFLMQNRLNISVSEVISTYVYQIGLGSVGSNDYAYSTAIGMFNSVINLMLLTTVNAISRKVSETSLW